MFEIIRALSSWSYIRCQVVVQFGSASSSYQMAVDVLAVGQKACHLVPHGIVKLVTTWQLVVVARERCWPWSSWPSGHRAKCLVPWWTRPGRGELAGRGLGKSFRSRLFQTDRQRDRLHQLHQLTTSVSLRLERTRSPQDEAISCKLWDPWGAGVSENDQTQFQSERLWSKIDQTERFR